MITIVSQRTEIEALQRKFLGILKKTFSERTSCRVGYPGGSIDCDVYYSSEYGIWFAAHREPNRFWNGFGIGAPIDWNSNSITGEINFPFVGINRRIAGAFGREDNGNILVLHRGKIGGGRRGVGKSLFVENFRGDSVVAIDNGRESRFYVVGELHSPLIVPQVANFVTEIGRIKAIGTSSSGDSFDYLNDFSYREEHAGQTVIVRSGRTIISRTHGIVVSALAKELEGFGLVVANDQQRDLFTHSSGRIRMLFEIKTSSSTQCIYSAVGQLIIYSIPIRNPVKRFVVLPERLNAEVEKTLSDHGIQAIYYSWKNGQPKFSDLKRRVK